MTDKGSSIDKSVIQYINEQFDQSMNWKDAEYCVNKWGGPFALKGVMSIEDAKKAIDIGCSAIMISNHGGRQLDGSRAPFDQVKAIAANFEVTDGPDSQGEMFTRPGRPSDKFVSPYPNVQAAMAVNGGAYPPDMSVLVKARKGGADYIYSVLMGYEEAPGGFELEDGVYYNEYMDGNKIKMAKPLTEGLVSYADGTEATESQMAMDVTTFLTWASEPHLEARHQTGLKVIMYLIILTILVYLSMRRLWSRIDPKE